MSSAPSTRRPAPYGVELELVELGHGPAVVFLHDESGANLEGAFVRRLADSHRVLLPSHPGFGQSSVPSEFDSVEDLVFFYSELIEDLDLGGYALVGCSFGGWLAAELAVRRPPGLERLVMVDAFGIRVGGIEDRDIVDIFAADHEQLAELLFSDPQVAAGELDFSARSDDDLELIARNREALARYAWQPYLHNPRLRARLHRVAVPTLVVWGAQDGIVDTSYGQAFAAAIPGARFEAIEGAGHLPHIERPEEASELVLAFLDEHS
jgi:pimeloyl-ACP methyl ester carboxylesterase